MFSETTTEWLRTAEFDRHRERFAIKRKFDRDTMRAKEQFGPDGMGTGPEDDDPDHPQRMAVA